MACRVTNFNQEHLLKIVNKSKQQHKNACAVMTLHEIYKTYRRARNSNQQHSPVNKVLAVTASENAPLSKPRSCIPDVRSSVAFLKRSVAQSEREVLAEITNSVKKASPAKTTAETSKASFHSARFEEKIRSGKSRLLLSGDKVDDSKGIWICTSSEPLLSETNEEEGGI